MDEIRRQVLVARRRLVLQQFLTILPVALFGALLLGAIGLAAPKLWVLGVDSATWTAGWLGGSLGLGLVVAVVWTWVTSRREIDAAIEVDRRFGLKERVTSALTLSPRERDSEAGHALVSDALRRVSAIEIREKFGVAVGARALLPLLPALVAFALVLFVADKQDRAKAASNPDQELAERVKRASESLKQRLAKKREQIQESGLKEADDLIKKIHDGFEDIAQKDGVDRKQALMKINNLSKELADRRQQIGDPEQMKKQFEGLKDIEKGPADKMAQAIKEGDFNTASKQVEQLRDKLENGQLTDEEKEQLAEQMRQMQQKMREMAERHEQAKAELERRIQEKMESGDMEAVNKLQRQLDALEQQDGQMQRMQAMADKLQQAAEAMEQGDSARASQQLQEFSEDLDQMATDMEQLQSLDELMDEIADAKNAMQCESCNGAGCSQCQGGMGNPQFALDRFSQEFGSGMGEGPGGGFRPEQESDTGVYDSRVRGQPKAGEAVRMGGARGPNKAGNSFQNDKEEILSSLKADADPLTDQRLPKAQRDHVREYYQRFNSDE